MKQDQQTRILNLLAAANGGWVGLPAILDLRISQYAARVCELRRQGYNIENRTEQHAEGVRHSWYRLVSAPATPAAQA